MDYLFAKLDTIKELLRNKFILLLLDYDGTLTPIAESPQKAIISRETKDLLQELSQISNFKVGIISGRLLENIKHTVGVKNIIYAGNHGLEIEGPKIKFQAQISPTLKLAIRNLAQELRKRISIIKGAVTEDKILTLSIHYRLINKENIPGFEEIFSEVTKPYVTRYRLKINPGNKVYEIRPPVKWDKGKVALWLMIRQQFMAGEKKVLPIYIGDDTTDEDAFKALRKKGLTIVVGNPSSSSASYYVKDTQEVTRFLRLLSKIKP